MSDMKYSHKKEMNDVTQHFVVVLLVFSILIYESRSFQFSQAGRQAPTIISMI